MKKEFEVRIQYVTNATVYVQAADWEEAETLALSQEVLSGVAVEAGEWEVVDIDEQGE